MGHKVETQPRLGRSTLKNVTSLLRHLGGSAGTDFSQDVRVVAVVVAFAGLNKGLDANKFLDFIETLDKTLLTKCAEVNHLH